MNNLEKPVQYIKGVGPRLAKVLAKVGINTVHDLLYYFPRRYDDRRELPKLAMLYKYLGQVVSVRGRILSAGLINTRSRLIIVKASLIDDTARINVIWFNQPFLKNVLKKGVEIFVRGKVEQSAPRANLQINCQEYEVIKGADSISVNRVVPIYPLTEGLYQKKIRKLAWLVLDLYLQDLGDALEEKFRKANSLLWLAKAIKELHFPDGRKAWKEAHDRIVFDEFFYLQLRAALQFQFRKKVSKGRVLNFAGELLQRWEEALPYQLTAAQKKVISEIKEDLLKEKPMNRLLQGDVGSGKTEVALFSLLVAVQTGLQAAIMAPTEILAEQHYKKISARVNPLGVQVVYRVGSMLKKEREEADEKINNGEAQIVIGTHALLQEKVKFQDLGLVVIDEQHRFGVEQRLALIQKGIVPHTLIMTATPIPRTLALTFYGDLDKSVIDELPPGRIPIATKWIRENERNKLYDFAKKEIEKGQQVYIVYPLVEESEKVDLKAATESSKYLAEQVFNGYSVRLLHGKLKNKDKDKIMQEFREGKVQVLVATTVIEVGVDVPSASIMIIEHAERFGLAQLHQLRGRVGRGQAKAYCFLMGKPKTEEGKKRLAAMVQTTDGFKLAEVDLSLRGPGEFYGFRQSGIPDLNLADLIKDEPILLKARKLAQEVAEKDRELSLPEHYELKKELKRRLGDIWKMQVLN